ncbi:twin-arginine translocation signal domain-containing protein, partial [Candidatus Woesearchaeota archaeon]|nr:twin-arginine translocation signal domain-containing protein [Candidatus Woesearchaeota archaeon]
MITRRQLLKGAAIGVLGLGGSLMYLNQEMQPAPEKPGLVLCDLHAHPANYWSLEDTVAFLSSPGLIGLGHVNATSRNLTYEQAVTLVQSRGDFQEITPGKLAKVGKGYFCRAQEVGAGVHDLVVVGWDGNYFPEFNDYKRALEEIRSHKGTVILAHPDVIASGGFEFRLANEQESIEAWELYSLVDEVE